MPQGSGEQRLQLALEAGRLGLWEADLPRGTVQASARARRLLDCRSGESLSLQAWEQRTLPQDRARLHRWFAGIAAAHSERSGAVRHRLRQRNGHELWLEVSGHVLVDAEGHAERIVGTVVDITRRKRSEAGLRDGAALSRQRRKAERELRDREQRLQLALDASALHPWTFDPATHAVDAGPALRACWGLAAGPPLRRARWWQRIAAEDRRRVLAAFVAALAGQASLDLEFRVDAGEGEGPSRWLQLRAILVRDESPRLYGVCADVSARRRQEQAVRAGGEQLRLALDAARMVTWSLDLQQQRIELGAGMAEMLGLVPEAYCSVEHWLAHIHPEDRERTRRALALALEQRGEFDQDYRVLLRNGRTRWISAQAMVIRDESGAAISAQGIATDITARKRAEQKLRDRERQLRNITNAVPVGIIRCSRDLRYLFVNRTYAKSFLQRSPEEVVGRPLRQLLGEERFANILPHIRCVLAGEPVQYESHYADDSGDHVLHTEYVPDVDAAGSVSGWIAVITDITERKRFEAHLFQREREFKTLVENAPDVIARLDRQLRYVYVNRAVESAFGIEAAAVIGHGVRELPLPPEVSEAITDAAREAFASGSEQATHFSHWRNEVAHHYVARLLPEADREEQIDSVLMIVYDLTERFEAQAERERLLEAEHSAREQAEAAARARDQFLAIVSHELRSPLNGIQCWTHVLESHVPEQVPVVQRALSGIKAGVEQQARLIDDLLDATRIMSGKLSIVKQPVRVQPVLEAALTSVRAALQGKNLALDSSLEVAGAQISGDPDRLQQIAWNLLSNAIKFTAPGGHVGFHAVCQDGELQLVVRDDGKGIDPAFLPYLFDWFRRDETATSRGQDGLGLGLALVRHLCELHGGTVEAESAGPGHGASFTVRLPLRVPTAVVQPWRRPLIDGAGRAAQLDGLQVLLVEDQAETRESIALLLQQAGAAVVTLASGEDALQWLARASRPPDVLVSDIAMPGEDGYSLLGKIRARELQAGIAAAARLPAIALTALAQREDRLRAFAAGFQAHLRKPVAPAELISAIASLVRSPQRQAASAH